MIISDLQYLENVDDLNQADLEGGSADSLALANASAAGFFFASTFTSTNTTALSAGFVNIATANSVSSSVAI